MEKNEFILRVTNVDDLEHEHKIDVIDYGFTISVSAWEVGGRFMIDQHITDFYPELIDLGIEELQEGDMYYDGNLTKHELAHVLRTYHGFDVEVDGQQYGFEPTESGYNKIQSGISKKDLETQLKIAIEQEHYEKAAELRDKINEI